MNQDGKESEGKTYKASGWKDGQENNGFTLFAGSEAKKDRLKFLKMTKNGKNLTAK